MVDILEFDNRQTYLDESLRRGDHGNDDDYPASAGSGKDLARQIDRLSAPDAVQENWSRIVLRDIAETRELSCREIWQSRYIFLRENSSQQSNEPPQALLDNIVDFISSGGRQAVIQVWRALHALTRDDKDIAAALKTFETKLTDVVQTTSGRNRRSGGLIPHDTGIFIHRARRLDCKGRTDDALDLLFDETDDMMWAGRFSDLDAMIAGIHVNEFSAEMLLGILTATLPAADKLPSRATFFHDVQGALKQRGELEEGLLTGLE